MNGVRLLVGLASTALVAAGCGATTAPPSVVPTASPTSSSSPSSAAPTAATAAPPATTAVPSATSVPTATAAPAEVPAGRILFHRLGFDGNERYFTIDTDGTDEHALFTAEGCGCAQWSADWMRILTLGDTGHGTYSFTTLKPDGSDRRVMAPAIRTLNLAPGATSADGRWIAFQGWDETDPFHSGLYLASPDLTGLRLVTSLPEGTKAVEPFGITPDGVRIVFFGERGPANGVTHAGDVFVIDADGSGLRQLNPAGTSTGFIGYDVISLSPDGRHAAFSAYDGTTDHLYVVDIDSGEARRITDRAGGIWAVSWSPTGEWIAYTQQHGRTPVVALIRPDGTGPKDLSEDDPSVEARGPAWSPDGKHLLVQRGTDGRADLWITDLEGRWIGRVTHETSNYGTYSWAPASGT